MVSIAEAIFAVGGLLVLIGILASALSVVKDSGQGIDISQLLLMYFGQSHTVPAPGADCGTDDPAARAVLSAAGLYACSWSSSPSGC